VRRIDYAGSVHGEEEISACLEVLRGGATALRIGKNAIAFEEEIARLFGKRRGVMCNSGSSALYLAVELIGLPRGSEIVTAPLTFSTDIAPIVRAGLVPVFVDVELDTYQIDVARIEEAIGPDTRAILAPNLIGNCPDWDAIRAIADRHGLSMIEDSCDCLGALLRGTPTGSRSHISVTSFALSHIITGAGTGGMVLLDDPALADRCLTLRRWGRRSEPQFFGTRKGDNLFIFDEIGWNFEPSELSAAFGRVQLRRLPGFLERRKRNFARLCAHLARYPDVFALPRTTAELDTAWHLFPIQIRPGSGVRRGELQQWLEGRGVDTRMIWSGNILRQPAFRKIAHRAPADGLPNADRVMETGLVLPCNHAMSDEDVDYVCETIDAFLARR
jgi:CDP-6-deoxy-D-xylo-4-hexulose-3-dehydrase